MERQFVPDLTYDLDTLNGLVKRLDAISAERERCHKAERKANLVEGDLDGGILSHERAALLALEQYVAEVGLANMYRRSKIGLDTPIDVCNKFVDSAHQLRR